MGPGIQDVHSHGWTPEQACRAHGLVDVRGEERHMDLHDILAVLATAPAS